MNQITFLPLAPGELPRTLGAQSITFTVYGQAQPAGSKSSFVPRDKRTGQPFQKNGRIIVNTVDSNPKSKDWKQQVSYEARKAYTGQLLEGPLRFTLTVYRVRPAGHYKKSKGVMTGELNTEGLSARFPITKPDVLKLARGVEDALSGVLYRDDAQICDERLLKVWGPQAKIEVTIETL